MSVQFVVILLWAVAFGTGLAVVYAMDSVGYMATMSAASDVANAFNNTFSRSAWGLALGWLIFACFHGYGGEHHMLQQKYH